MKYEYRGTIYNMNRFYSVVKKGFIDAPLYKRTELFNKYVAIGIRNNNVGYWSDKNMIFCFDTEEEYNKFLTEYKNSQKKAVKTTAFLLSGIVRIF